MRAYKIYIGVMLFVIAGLLAVLTAAIILAGIKLRDAKTQVNNFNQKADNINKTLQSIDGELQNYNTKSLPGNLVLPQ